MPEDTKPRDLITLSVASVVLAGFGALIIFLLAHLDLSETGWIRATYLLTGVEAIVFAAAGFLFGREVQRGRAESAENRLKEVEKKIDANAAGKEQGIRLAGAIQALAGTFGAMSVAPGNETYPSPATFEELARMAQTLFPVEESGR